MDGLPQNVLFFLGQAVEILVQKRRGLLERLLDVNPPGIGHLDGQFPFILSFTVVAANHPLFFQHGEDFCHLLLADLEAVADFPDRNLRQEIITGKDVALIVGEGRACVVCDFLRPFVFRRFTLVLITRAWHSCSLCGY